VTILTNADDFNAAKSYYTFLQECFALVAKHPEDNVMDVFRAATNNLPDEADTFRKFKLSDRANFLRLTNRKIGQRKDLTSKCSDDGAFEDPSCLSEVDKAKRERYWEDHRIQGVFKAYAELAEAHGEEKHSCTIESLLMKFNDMNVYDPESGNVEMQKTEVKQIMRDLEKDVLFVKKSTEDSREPLWTVKNFKVFTYMINDDLEEPDERDDVY
jgi:hypothetical protein